MHLCKYRKKDRNYSFKNSPLNTSIPADLFSTLPLSCYSEWQELLDAHENAAVTSVRLNPDKAHHTFEKFKPVPWCMQGIYLEERPVFTADPLLHAGCYYVQEASSMFLDWILRQAIPKKNNLRVLDLCASPGGKSTLVAGLLPLDALLLSNEVVPNRVQALVENTVKWGHANHWISNNSAAQIGQLENYFDILLVDAPCSGSGLFRKIPEFRSEWKMEDVKKCALRQKAILNEALPSLAKDGLLVYMTCSFSVQENEEMIDYILKTNDLEPVFIPIHEDWGIQVTQGTEGRGWGYRFMPNHVEGEGFFLSLFRKTGGRDRRKSFLKKNPTPALGKTMEYIQSEEMKHYLINDQYFLLHPEHLPDLQDFGQKLRMVKRGSLLGKFAGKDFIPDHELAMSIHVSKEIDHMDVSKETALAFLKKENIQVGNMNKGWKLVRYLGSELGWVKSVPGRVNNYYPSGYRILNKNIGLLA